jgi:hypothetical protein
VRDDEEEQEVVAEHVDALGQIMMGGTVDGSGADYDDIDFTAPLVVDSVAEIECREVIEDEPVSDRVMSREASLHRRATPLSVDSHEWPGEGRRTPARRLCCGVWSRRHIPRPSLGRITRSKR